MVGDIIRYRTSREVVGMGGGDIRYKCGLYLRAQRGRGIIALWGTESVRLSVGQFISCVSMSGSDVLESTLRHVE